MNNIISFFINKTLHILPYHTRTKWHERESCHLEELLSKWNSNYRNAPNTTHYQVSKCHFPSKKYNPYKISFPNGQNAKVANLKHCRPTGIPIIVIHHMQPAKIHASPPSNPPNINQRILPIVLMTTSPHPMSNILLQFPLLSHISL